MKFLCLMFHDWWDPRHVVEMRDVGMAQHLYCRSFHVWRKR